MLKRASEIGFISFDKCHDGIGSLLSQSMLSHEDGSNDFSLFHFDILPPGVSIGEHVHGGHEEIYYLVEGECTLIFDGEELHMKSGDFSVCGGGHSHGIINTGTADAKLIVVGGK